MRAIREDEVTFTLTAEDEDIPVRGNAMASGDPDLDKRVEDGIIERLDGGDIWAWCYVRVTARLTLPDGSWFEGTDGLGGCSYHDQSDFMESGGYYDDMKTRALEDLQEKIETAVKRGVILAVVFADAEVVS